MLNDISVEGLLLPVQGATITKLKNVTMPHHGLQQLWKYLTYCPCLVELNLWSVTSYEHVESVSMPILDLQSKIKILELYDIEVEGLILPEEGGRMRSLRLYNVIISHHGLEKLVKLLSSLHRLDGFYLDSIMCSQHGFSSCQPIKDLKKLGKMLEINAPYQLMLV